jgi:hypothetical protein
MASNSEAKWKALQLAMSNRLVWAASNADEFVHAAVTQVAFNHCKSFYDGFRLVDDEQRV